jgi:hypothetical protein
MTPFEPGWHGGGTHVEPDRELERLLAQFFKRQLPFPWPRFSTPVAQEAAIKSAGRTGRSMALFALAASVLMLVISQYCLSRLYSPRFHNRPDTGEVRNEATNRNGRFRSQPIQSKESRGSGDVGVLSGKR